MSITAPANNATVHDIVDGGGDRRRQHRRRRRPVPSRRRGRGAEDTQSPYTFQWDTRAKVNGRTHTDRAGARRGRERDHIGVGDRERRQHELLPERRPRHRVRPADGDDVPPRRPAADRSAARGHQGAVAAVHAGRPTLFNQITNIGSAGVQQGIFDIKLDPNFTTNHFYYVFYTAGTPNRDRLSRFTANAALNGTVPGSELVLYQDPKTPAPNTTAEASCSATTARSISRPASTSTPPTHSLSPPRGARSTASTRTAPSRPTTRSTTATARTWTRSGRGPAQPVPRLLRRAVRSHVRGRRRRQRRSTRRRKRSTSVRVVPTTDGRTSKGTVRRRARARCTPTTTR